MFVVSDCQMAVSTVLPPRTISDQEFFEAFLDVTTRWHLSDRERRALLDVPERTFYNWKAGRVHLQNVHRQRIALISNIYLHLHSLFGSDNEDLANTWIKQPNEQFEGAAPLSAIQHGGFPMLVRVHDYLMGAQ